MAERSNAENALLSLWTPWPTPRRGCRCAWAAGVVADHDAYRSRGRVAPQRTQPRGHTPWIDHPALAPCQPAAKRYPEYPGAAHEVTTQCPALAQRSLRLHHQEVHRVAPSLDRGAACRGTPRPYPRRPRPSSSTRARSASAGRTLHLPAPPVTTAASSALPRRPPERGARRPALRRPRAHDVVRSCRPLHPPPPPQRRRARQEISPRPAIVLLPQPTALASRRAALPDLCCTSAPVRHGNTAGAAPAAATAGARGGAETPLPLHLATLVAQRRQALSSGLLNPPCSSCANSAQRAAPRVHHQSLTPEKAGPDTTASGRTGVPSRSEIRPCSLD